ncbi:lipid-A-disaccharide synthase [Fibrobacter sp. UWT2]|uniref:lipid-A-disaccharide synthase n=1 Tax=Fibrobacter sp. UWT2 TaxID=1896224 RepID=UPI0009107760|nr:hypothetical protein [Fibrobacter sp. UWT2]SHK71833.1 lipid-A-disaccharide synthase [Fibrobacter sp. UWT2]
MPNGKPYILFCAGEDSGDCIGEPLVKAIASQYVAKGSGGKRMQNAGLLPLVDFENLPVSGFGDVLPKYFELRKSFNKLKIALESPECLGLVAIDYPGFNMKLAKLAGKLRKPVLYVAPPQVWAWKRKRAQVLAKNPYAKLAVFFDFEEAVYKAAGCNVVRVQHPFCEADSVASHSSKNILLFPGSRKSQALRNLPVFLKAVQKTQNVILVAARQELVPAFKKYNLQVVVAPQSVEDRMSLYRSAEYAITAPGTATLELALSGVPFTVCTRPDPLTYVLGRLFIKTKFFALPNIILGRLVFPEHIVSPWCTRNNVNLSCTKCDDVSAEIREKLAVGKTLEQLAFEFLGQLVEREPQ